MWRRLIELSSDERADLLPALWRLSLVRLWLAATSIEATKRRFNGRLPAKQTGPYGSLDIWYRRATALKRAGRYVPGARCLARSLALRWWMRSKALDARILIGVRASSRGLQTHSWVQLGCRPVDESVDEAITFRVIKTERDLESAEENIDNHQA